MLCTSSRLHSSLFGEKTDDFSKLINFLLPFLLIETNPFFIWHLLNGQKVRKNHRLNLLRRTGSLAAEINEDVGFSVAPTPLLLRNTYCFYHRFPHLFRYRSSRSLFTPHQPRPAIWEALIHNLLILTQSARIVEDFSLHCVSFEMTRMLD
ncbi:hypothetical protein SAMN06265218_11283 [Fodinibius sediminis]|uniref:Uncharacterized protein n=1 Tax=Fodinibius sediminis TaxID=1214077 RepID=A0A521DZ78_9BACT|nr:hypothetical protein SAMN06265218_11283 [Fodinibius sediminis]